MWQSRDFWERADKAVNADGELLALHDAYRTAEIPAFPAAAVPDAAPGRVESTSVAPDSCAAVFSDAGDGPGLAGLLTGDERQAVRQAGRLYTFIAERVVAGGANRSDDLAELRAACHVIQRAVLAQAAARAHPEEFRLLGDVVTARSTGTGDNAGDPSPSGSGAAGQVAVIEDLRLWVRLKNDLEQEIALGILEPGDEVWVAYAAKDAGVSVGTAAKALQALAKEGKLEPQGAPRPYLVPASPPLEPPSGQQTPPPPTGRAADRPGSPP